MRRVCGLLAVVLSWLALASAASATVRIDIDLSSQTMHVETADGATHDWPISSARAGFSTPRGYYRPQRLERMHFSKKYHNSPMPHSIFFRGGYAIHGTGAVRQLGRPASHGCIRLAPGNAAALFALVKSEGGRIQITGSPPHSTLLADARPKREKTVAAARRARVAVAREHRRAHRGDYAAAARPARYAAASAPGRFQPAAYDYAPRRHSAQGGRQLQPFAYAPAAPGRLAPVRVWQASPWGWVLR